MVKVLKQKGRFLFFLEALMSLTAVMVCMTLRFYSPGADSGILTLELVLKGFLYTGILCLSLFLNDAYQVQILANRRQLLPRLARSGLMSILLYAVVTAVVPEQTQGRLVFAGSVLLSSVLLLALHRALHDVLNGRMFLEKVLVVGDGPLAETLRKELLSADYHQQLRQDPALEASLVDATIRLGRGDLEAEQMLEHLDGELDLIVMAMTEADWILQRHQQSSGPPRKAAMNGSLPPASDGVRISSLQSAGQRPSSPRGVPANAPGTAALPGVSPSALPAGSTAARSAAAGSAAAGSSASASGNHQADGGSPRTSQVVALDAHRRKPRHSRLSARNTLSGFKAHTGPGEAQAVSDRDALVRGMVGLKLSGIPVVRGLDYYEQLTGRVYIGAPQDALFFFRSPYRIDKLSHTLKAVWEWGLALAIFVAVIPFLILVPIAIYLDDGRNPLFIQQRVGRFGNVYSLYKWRSMDDKGNVTRVGRIIRKTKLDELPQLINVLRGEMSLVGPRPEMPRFVKQFEDHTPYYSLRHMVRPGLTGWAQIMFPDAKAEDAMVKLSLDLYYVKHFSLVSDIVIMAETLKMILFGGMARTMRANPPVQIPQLSLVKSDHSPDTPVFQSRERGDRIPELISSIPAPRPNRVEQGG